MVVCKNCAGQSPDGATTCVHCGARLVPYTPEEARAYIASLQPEVKPAEPESRPSEDDSHKSAGSAVCTNCGYQGEAGTQTPGSFLAEVALWLCFIVPGVIYSVWRLTARRKVCPQCKQPTMIPIDTPKGQELAKTSAESTLLHG